MILADLLKNCWIQFGHVLFLLKAVFLCVSICSCLGVSSGTFMIVVLTSLSLMSWGQQWHIHDCCVNISVTGKTFTSVMTAGRATKMPREAPSSAWCDGCLCWSSHACQATPRVSWEKWQSYESRMCLTLSCLVPHSHLVMVRSLISKVVSHPLVEQRSTTLRDHRQLASNPLTWVDERWPGVKVLFGIQSWCSFNTSFKLCEFGMQVMKQPRVWSCMISFRFSTLFSFFSHSHVLSLLCKLLLSLFCLFSWARIGTRRNMFIATMRRFSTYNPSWLWLWDLKQDIQYPSLSHCTTLSIRYVQPELAVLVFLV